MCRSFLLITHSGFPMPHIMFVIKLLRLFKPVGLCEWFRAPFDMVHVVTMPFVIFRTECKFALLFKAIIIIHAFTLQKKHNARHRLVSSPALDFARQRRLARHLA